MVLITSLSITDIALRKWDLSIIGIAENFFEIIVVALVLKGLSCPSLVTSDAKLSRVESDTSNAITDEANARENKTIQSTKATKLRAEQ